jgi:hypothetical protein
MSHRQFIRVLIFALLAGGSGLLAGEVRTWTNTDGRAIAAEFVSLDTAQGKVKLKLANSTEPSVELAKLSEADRKWITDHLRSLEAAQAALKQNAGKTVSLKSDGPEAVTYHVYYPTTFDPAKPPAMIILFSPGGSGVGMLNAVKAACEDVGWIGVGCDVFRNNVSESVLDPKWAELLPAIEKNVRHDPDLLYLGGMSGGALRAYDYSETTVRPWKGVLAFGGWLGGKQALRCPKKMLVARLNGDKDAGALSSAKGESPILEKARATVKDFIFPGGHVIAPPNVTLEALRWLKANTVPGPRLSDGKRTPAPHDRDNGTK